MASGSTKQPVFVQDEDDEIPCNTVGPPVNSKGRKLKSDAWVHMAREVRSDNTVKATCNYCVTVFNASKTSGTSHLKRHIRSCPKRINHDIRNYCITGDGSNSGKLASMSLRNHVVNLKNICRAICIYVVAGAHPFTTCEEPGFKFLLSTACPQFSVISRQTLKRDALRCYNDEKNSITELLQNAPGRISFTTNNWKSEHIDDEYMCITAHWIDDRRRLQKRIIKFSALTPPFDGQSLADEISLCLAQCKIDRKVLGFTVDNASYNDAMIRFLRSDLSRQKFLLFDGEFFHIRCACHIINLVVQAGLKLIDDVVFKIRSVVKHLKHSIPKNKHFYGVAKTMFHLDTRKKLRVDNLIRWNSTFVMLDRFLFYKDVVDHVVGRDKDIKGFAPTSEEWNRVSVLRDFLKTFYDVTNTFSASKTQTANFFFHGVWKIRKKLTDVSEGPVNLLSNMVKEMEKKFEKYWSDYI